MRRSTLAVLALAVTAAALAACGRRQSLYLDSGRADSSPAPAAGAPRARPAFTPAQPAPSRGEQPSRP